MCLLSLYYILLLRFIYFSKSRANRGVRYKRLRGRFVSILRICDVTSGHIIACISIFDEWQCRLRMCMWPNPLTSIIIIVITITQSVQLFTNNIAESVMCSAEMNEWAMGIAYGNRKINSRNLQIHMQFINIMCLCARFCFGTITMYVQTFTFCTPYTVGHKRYKQATSQRPSVMRSV